MLRVLRNYVGCVFVSFDASGFEDWRARVEAKTLKFMAFYGGIFHDYIQAYWRRRRLPLNTVNC